MVLLLLVYSICRGISFNAYFGDFSNYTNAWLHQLLSAGEQAHHGLAVSVESWRRQRRYTDWALEVRQQLLQLITSLKPECVLAPACVCACALLHLLCTCDGCAWTGATQSNALCIRIVGCLSCGTLQQRRQHAHAEHGFAAFLTHYSILRVQD